MSSEIAISARNLSKVYRIYERPEHRLIQMATLGRVRRFKEFAALHDVSFDVRRGETIGIVGRNGCGKSTLLQMICGTLQPTSGSVSVNGRIAALLELGAGFNGEFTGRENVYMNGAILGFSREEMDERFDDIARFAGIGEFIERPVKTYSSGMFVRLAFAVATAVEPDILVVDEALAVGDEAFQRKCYARIEAIKERGGTILFVSHGAQTIVQLCDRAILLDAGEKLLEGEPKVVVSQYQRLINLDPSTSQSLRAEIRRVGQDEQQTGGTDLNLASAGDRTSRGPDARSTSASPARMKDTFDPDLVSQSVVEYEAKGALISNARLLSANGERVNVVFPRRRYTYAYDVQFNQHCTDVSFGMLIKTVSGLELGGAATTFNNEARLREVPAGARLTVEFEFDCIFMPGTYFVNAGVLGTTGGESHYLHRQLDALVFRVSASDRLDGTGQVDIGARINITTEEQNALATKAG